MEGLIFGILRYFWTVFICSFPVLRNSHLKSAVCRNGDSESLPGSYFPIRSLFDPSIKEMLGDIIYPIVPSKKHRGSIS